MPLFVCLRQFKFAISLATDLEQLLEPLLTGNEIRSIYIQSFPYHYRLDLVQASSFPHSNDHMEDIVQKTNFFASIHDIEMVKPIPPVLASCSFSSHKPLVFTLPHGPSLPRPYLHTDMDCCNSTLGGIPLIRATPLPDFITFTPSNDDYNTNATLDLHLHWEDLPEYSQPSHAALYHHAAEYLMFKLDMLNWEDNLLNR